VIRELSSELPRLRGSRDMIVEAFKVIVKNAAEAIAEKGDEGKIVVKTELRDGALVEVTISDNGVGIRPEHLERIFEMRWSTKGGAGLGFGLFWARDYIQGLGGTVGVQSTYGEGATFKIRIPHLGAPV
jgi:signal transduction histidine kinase